VWLDRMHNDPAFNASWHLFWEAHPDRDGVFAPDVSFSFTILTSGLFARCCTV
jgi:hypothetical protein